MKIISLIGNCQTVSLCFYLQQLLDPNMYKVNWLLYGTEFRVHLGSWSMKCTNKVLAYDKIISEIQQSDIIIYQEVASSNFSNPLALYSLKKNSTQLIKLPSIYLEKQIYNESLLELKKREELKKVDIKVSEIFEKYKQLDYEQLMLTKYHPTTFLFIELLKILAEMIKIPFYSDEMIDCFMKDTNYMQLPPYYPPKGPRVICHKDFNA